MTFFDVFTTLFRLKFSQGGFPGTQGAKVDIKNLEFLAQPR